MALAELLAQITLRPPPFDKNCGLPFADSTDSFTAFLASSNVTDDKQNKSPLLQNLDNVSMRLTLSIPDKETLGYEDFNKAIAYVFVHPKVKSNIPVC